MLALSGSVSPQGCRSSSSSTGARQGPNYRVVLSVVVYRSSNLHFSCLPLTHTHRPGEGRPEQKGGDEVTHIPAGSGNLCEQQLELFWQRCLQPPLTHLQENTKDGGSVADPLFCPITSCWHFSEVHWRRSEGTGGTGRGSQWHCDCSH